MEKGKDYIFLAHDADNSGNPKITLTFMKANEDGWDVEEGSAVDVPASALYSDLNFRTMLNTYIRDYNVLSTGIAFEESKNNYIFFDDVYDFSDTMFKNVSIVRGK